MASFNTVDGAPIIMSVAGDVYVDSCRIAVIIWEGVTSSGDTVTLTDRVTNQILWKGRTADTQTYLGGNFSVFNIPCPHGFKLAQINNGTLYIYLASI